MEKILNSNSFSKKDLHKPFPACASSDFSLGLEINKNMVQDAHNFGHSCNGDSCSRRAIHKKTCKESMKLNKEIVKLKNSFVNTKMKEEIMKKHPKNNFSDVQQKLKYTNRNNIKITEETYESFNLDSILGLSENAKEGATKKNDNEKNRVTEEINLTGINEAVDHKVVKNTTATNDGEDYIDNKHKLDTTSKSIEDLQSLLIMMAITSKDGDAESDRDNKSNEAISDTNELLFTSVPLHTCNMEKLDFLHITPLKSEIIKRQENLMLKYVNKWKRFVKNKHDNLDQIRKSQLNNFFNKLEKKKTGLKGENKMKKSASLIQDCSTYQHRYKMQKHIIALQKAKLEEQNRLIDELKYNKIVEASKNSVDAMKEEVRKTYFEIDRQLKPKIKCLTNELKLHEIEEPSLILHCLKVPQFLQRMEKRAREREEKHAIIRERRRQMEEERIRLKQQAELAKAEMDKEEKYRIIKELREKRKREKVENIRKKQHADRMRAMKVMAELHYERNVKLRCGLKPWIKLIKMKRDNIEKAKVHYKFQLKKNVFLHWMWHTEDMWFDRNYKAEDFYRKKSMLKVFDAFTKNYHDYVLKRQVAEDYYDLYLLQLGFNKFKEGILVLKREEHIKMVKADEYYKCNLLFKVFILWHTLPALNALKREQDIRKMKWREKVLQVVPDYKPPDD